jgi:citrate lyase subunit beta/citryl-CoA lyase
MSTLATARSFLFVPGSDEHKLAGALAAGADAVIADLEDAVVPEEKERARSVVTEAFAGGRSAGLRLVRVNGTRSPWHEDDLAAVAELDVDGIVLPKAEPDALPALGESLPVVAIVETAVGLHRAAEIGGAPQVEGLMLGAIDLALELGLDALPDGLELLPARSAVVLASAVARCRGPIDRVWVDVLDERGLEADCRAGRSLGFRGKSCIHPAQVAVVNEVFSPSPREITRAREVVDAYERAAAEGRGAVALDGEMIDLPVVERARHVLAEAKRSVLDGE